jgi:hypothetical protein
MFNVCKQRQRLDYVITCFNALALMNDNQTMFPLNHSAESNKLRNELCTCTAIPIIETYSSRHEIMCFKVTELVSSHSHGTIFTLLHCQFYRAASCELSFNTAVT